MAEDESFPWKMSIADMSCYTFASHVNLGSLGQTPGLRSRLKVTRTVQPVAIVDHFTTTVTFSALTKSLQYVIHNPRETATSTKHDPPKGAAVSIVHCYTYFTMHFLQGTKKAYVLLF